MTKSDTPGATVQASASFRVQGVRAGAIRVSARVISNMLPKNLQKNIPGQIVLCSTCFDLSKAEQAARNPGTGHDRNLSNHEHPCRNPLAPRALRAACQTPRLDKHPELVDSEHGEERPGLL